MKCPYCKADKNTVTFCGRKEEDRTRLGYYRRKRRCLSCQRTFWTIEEYITEDEARELKIEHFQKTINEKRRSRK
jgi:transcriptional regulator NrdR family protein